MENKRDKKNNISKIIVSIIMLVYFMGVGAFLGAYESTILPKENRNGWQIILSVVVLMMVVYLCLFIHFCVHEIGHMIFGLLTGYSFVSIRFANIIIYKTENGIKIGRYSLAGTGGQCIMMPPELPIEEIPTALYNWGGVIVNVVVSAIFGLLLIIPGVSVYVQIFSATMVLIGVFLIFTNGIPVEYMGNDGYNAIALGKDIKSKKAFVISFRMVGQMQLGLSPKDFPEEWFEWSYEPGDGALASSLGIQKLSWFITNKQFEKSYELAKYIDENVTNLALTSQMVVKLEMLFSMIMINKDVEEIEGEYKKLQKDIKALKQIPSTQRLLYAYHKLIDKDVAKAEDAKKMFDKIAKKYPYPLDVECERELMQLVDER